MCPAFRSRKARCSVSESARGGNRCCFEGHALVHRDSVSLACSSQALSCCPSMLLSPVAHRLLHSHLSGPGPQSQGLGISRVSLAGALGDASSGTLSLAVLPQPEDHPNLDLSAMSEAACVKSHTETCRGMLDKFLLPRSARLPNWDVSILTILRFGMVAVFFPTSISISSRCFSMRCYHPQHGGHAPTICDAGSVGY